MVEQRTENPRVVGSIPTGGTITETCLGSADLAHLVERDLAKVEVAGSSPVIRSRNPECESIQDFLLFALHFSLKIALGILGFPPILYNHLLDNTPP